MVFKKRKGIFIGITSILVLASIFMVPVFRYGESFAIRQYLLSFSNSEPESLSEILSYLEKPLSRWDFKSFSKRLEFIVTVAEGANVHLHPRTLFSLLDEAQITRACSSQYGSTGIFWETCERMKFDAEYLDSSKVATCTMWHFPKNQEVCYERNNRILSLESDSHCSKAECLLDHAILQSEIASPQSPKTPCLKIHSSLQDACLKNWGQYVEYQKNPASFFRKDLEDIILFPQSDPIRNAARFALLENPDSPAFECFQLESGDMREACERLSKELFSYVQLRNLRLRFDRISGEFARIRNSSLQIPLNLGSTNQ